MAWRRTTGASGNRADRLPEALEIAGGKTMYDFETRIERRGTDSVKWDIDNPKVNGEGMLPMWVADMDFACPPEVTEAIVQRAAHPIYGYSLKSAAFFASLQEWIRKRFGVEVETSWMAGIPGVVPGIHVAIEAYTSPGERVLIQTPVYHPFFHAVENRGRQVVRSSLREQDGHYEMDWDDLTKKLSDPAVKLMLLCSPHNPVGRVWTRQELERLGALCLEHGVIVVADEIHADLVYEQGSHTPYYSLPPELARQSVTFLAASKTFNLAGLFTSYLLTENRQLLRDFTATASRMGYENLNLFGMEATIAAYRHGEPWLNELLMYLQQNATYIQRYLSEHVPGVCMPVPQATYLGWMDFRRLGLKQPELNRLLREKAKLGFQDGVVFGQEGEGFQRINFACPRAVVEEAMERLKRAITE
ncbi:PatB family C-S lyase [Brevibacillus agri]|uniref:MalY/PatB family protein n=2 Tax=Brevibacillus TaxID=55080 RepID=UPI0002A52206|nr:MULTISPECIES: PatB family C-S lyase [Brevibacillus]ELK43677.1 aminotransferase [Brevibacillus agri BAB-2500]MDR9503158.1 PatB family C-S lyase [Brevibacillus agri]MED1823589.1 PatB family C-S lyase [Brevibacillus agri]